MLNRQPIIESIGDQPIQVILVQVQPTFEGDMAEIRNYFRDHQIIYEEYYGLEGLEERLANIQAKTSLVIYNKNSNRDIASHLSVLNHNIKLYIFPNKEGPGELYKTPKAIINRINSDIAQAIALRSKGIHLKSMKKIRDRNQIGNNYGEVLIYSDTQQNNKQYARLCQLLFKKKLGKTITTYNQLSLSLSYHQTSFLIISSIDSVANIQKYLAKQKIDNKIEFAVLGIQKIGHLNPKNIAIITDDHQVIVDFIGEKGINCKQMGSQEVIQPVTHERKKDGEDQTPYESCGSKKQEHCDYLKKEFEGSGNNGKILPYIQSSHGISRILEDMPMAKITNSKTGSQGCIPDKSPANRQSSHTISGILDKMPFRKISYSKIGSSQHISDTKPINNMIDSKLTTRSEAVQKPKIKKINKSQIIESEKPETSPIDDNYGEVAIRHRSDDYRDQEFVLPQTEVKKSIYLQQKPIMIWDIFTPNNEEKYITIQTRQNPSLDSKGKAKSENLISDVNQQSLTSIKHHSQNKQSYIPGGIIFQVSDEYRGSNRQSYLGQQQSKNQRTISPDKRNTMLEPGLQKNEVSVDKNSHRNTVSIYNKQKIEDKYTKFDDGSLKTRSPIPQISITRIPKQNASLNNQNSSQCLRVTQNIRNQTLNNKIQNQFERATYEIKNLTKKIARNPHNYYLSNHLIGPSTDIRQQSSKIAINNGQFRRQEHSNSKRQAVKKIDISATQYKQQQYSAYEDMQSQQNQKIKNDKIMNQHLLQPVEDIGLITHFSEDQIQHNILNKIDARQMNDYTTKVQKRIKQLPNTNTNVQDKIQKSSQKKEKQIQKIIMKSQEGDDTNVNMKNNAIISPIQRIQTSLSYNTDKETRNQTPGSSSITKNPYFSIKTVSKSQSNYTQPRILNSRNLDPTQYQRTADSYGNVIYASDAYGSKQESLKNDGYGRIMGNQSVAYQKSKDISQNDKKSKDHQYSFRQNNSHRTIDQRQLVTSMRYRNDDPNSNEQIYKSNNYQSPNLKEKKQVGQLVSNDRISQAKFYTRQQYEAKCRNGGISGFQKKLNISHSLQQFSKRGQINRQSPQNIKNYQYKNSQHPSNLEATSKFSDTYKTIEASKISRYYSPSPIEKTSQSINSQKYGTSQLTLGQTSNNNNSIYKGYQEGITYSHQTNLSPNIKRYYQQANQRLQRTSEKYPAYTNAEISKSICKQNTRNNKNDHNEYALSQDSIIKENLQIIYIHQNHRSLPQYIQKNYPRKFNIKLFQNSNQLEYDRNAIIMLHPETDLAGQTLPVRQFQSVYILGKTSKVPSGTIRIDQKDLEFIL